MCRVRTARSLNHEEVTRPTIASFTAEGLARRLDDPDDPKAKALLAAATVRICPNLNPDGSARGREHHRAVE